MKIIFLDIDGVLVPFQKFRPTHELEWSSQAINTLNHICQESGASVVISSQWRLQKQTNSCQKMTTLLQAKGVRAELHPDWRTPGKVSILKNRGSEILQWVATYKTTIDNWVVLEDFEGAKRYFPAEVVARIVQPDSYVGLTSVDAARVLELLR